MDRVSKRLAVVSIAFILCLFIWIGIQHRKIACSAEQSQQQAVELAMLRDTADIFRDKNGKLTYRVGVVEVNNSNLKESLETAGFDLKKLKASNIKLNSIIGALRMELATSGAVSVPLQPATKIIERDTVDFLKFESWTNGSLTLTNGEVFNKKLDFNYRYVTGIDIIPSKVKKGIIVNVMLTDSLASITTGNGIFVKPKETIWGKWWLWTSLGFAGGILITK